MTELRGERVVLRSLTEDDAPTLRAIADAPEVVAWWGPPAEDFPMSDDPRATRLTILSEREIVGLIQFGEEPEPEYRHAWIDIFLAPGRHGEGLGADALTALISHLVEDRGHHRITIDPAADNIAAIRSYERAGFRPVGVMRAAWRDSVSETWRDVLLMELVVLPAS